MTQPSTMTPESLTGLTVHDNDGSKVGKVGGVYLDAETSKPEWAAVKTGLFGSHETLVPLVNATASDDTLSVPYPKSLIGDAPHHDPDEELSQQAEAELFTYYGVSYGGDTVTAQPGTGPTGTTATTATTGTTGTAGVGNQTVAKDLSGEETDSAMTRSEERLQVGTQTVETGRARLRKYIVTENVTTTVPVSREEVRIEREPITDANRGAAYDGPALSEEEAEVTLHEERPVVVKETVPVERVKLSTETVTGEQQVSEGVRKEVIETEGVEERTQR